MKYSGTPVQISIQIHPIKISLSYIRTKPCTFDMTVRMLSLSLIFGSRIAGLKFCFWICAHNKTSAIKGFHLASTGSYHLGCVPEFHSVHFVILKQNMLTSHATCWVFIACLTVSKSLSHMQNKLHPFSSRLGVSQWELVPPLCVFSR